LSSYDQIINSFLEAQVKNPIPTLNKLGQSLWYDNIQRKLIEDGELARMIENGDIRGITSNPSIFHNAITKSNDYDLSLTSLAWSGKDAESIFWDLAIEDIRLAADLLLPVYKSSIKKDGYVSLEVSPLLANDTGKTISQARLLWNRVARPNLMIKIPATRSGITAIRETIASGINVNVTLIFSLQRYKEVMNAYMDGLEIRTKAGLPIDHIASVASFFVSRVDSKIDAMLQKIIADNPDQDIRLVSLMGDAAIANTKMAYAAFENEFTGKRFANLRANHSAQVQRPLWASTSTKNPNYPDTLYVDSLIGPDTVNTVPQATLDAFRDHGKAEVTLTRNLSQAELKIKELESVGISIDKVTQELEAEGVKAFEDAFTSLVDSIEARRIQAASQLGPHQYPIARRVARLAGDDAPRRLHAKDPSLWTMDPVGQNEIESRLGWLNSISTFSPLVQELNIFVDEIRAAGFKRVLLIGMGGSSLAPEVMASIFTGVIQNGLIFSIIDSTDPIQVADVSASFPINETLYIVSSKSGGTAEVNALFNYFWEASNQEGSQFVAITDSGTSLEDQAREHGFRRIFLSDPTIGGRFSALTPFGLVPAALMGIDLEKFLDRATRMVNNCCESIPAEMNPGLVLGAILGQMALDGREKLTLLSDHEFAPLGTWLEQLIAESSGKIGRGIVVVEGEDVRNPKDYKDDRLFVYLRTSGNLDAKVKGLLENGHPVITLEISDPYDLAAEFYRWEIAIATACSVIGVNAFDQPDVQLSKDITKKKVGHYALSNQLDEGSPAWIGEQAKVFSPSEIAGSNLRDILNRFLSSSGKYDYIGINAYLPRNKETVELLYKLRTAIGRLTGCATTVGFGPRFLHSTGQLQKGGENNGLFIQITSDPELDLEIPTQNMTFGILERAQALGDYESLVERERRIIRINFSSLAGLKTLVEAEI
jgi:transaldolase / glucose-6-phosphate isomerase